MKLWSGHFVLNLKLMNLLLRLVVIWNSMNCKKKKYDKIYQYIIMETLSLVILMGWHYTGRRTRRWRMWGGWFVTAPPARRTETWAMRPAGRTVSIGCSTLSGMALVLFYFYCILFCFFWGGGLQGKGWQNCSNLFCWHEY